MSHVLKRSYARFAGVCNQCTSKPVAVTNEILTGITLVIKTRDPGYERIVFRASRFKAGDDPTFGVGCNPITDTVFRQACAGVFSKVPYHVKEKIISRSNGTKKDFWLGLGIYVEPYKIEGRGDIEEAFAPCAQLGAVDYYFEKCVEEINQSILNGVITPWGALGATQTVFLPDNSDSVSGVDDADNLTAYDETFESYEANEDFDNGDDLCCTLEVVVKKSLTDELDPADFPTKRAYDVAFWLAWMEENNSDQPMAEYEQLCTERCLFIRENPDLLAAKYLTCDGDYLYAQAIKEHFSLPFEVEEEDERSETNLGDLIMDAMEFDTDLALEIWLWCIREFFPYRCYSVWPGDVVTCMDEHLFDCPDSFVQTLISRAAEEEWLCKALMTASEEYRYFVTHLISVALRNEDGQTAEKLFSAYISGDHAKDKDVYCVIEGIIDACSNWGEKETLELFRDRILPIAAEYPKNARVINGIKKWTKQVDEHIKAVESSAEKYAYSGRYLWRTTCADGSEYNLDPLNYETEEEYNDVLRARKYDWRRMRASGAAAVGLDINAYETLEEYQAALDERVAQRRKERQEQQEAERRQREAEKQEPDPLAATDKTTYPFCGVVFLNSEGVYHYRIKDTSLSIGDLVVVPVGKENRHLIAEIVSIEQHTRKSAPFPVDKAKFVVGRYDSGKTDGSTE